VGFVAVALKSRVRRWRDSCRLTAMMRSALSCLAGAGRGW
jgi:hypothetical protein